MDDHGDIGDTLAPKSDQLDNIELASGPRVFTVKSVDVKKDREQPVHVYFEEFPRPWKPGVNQRRVLGYCWGEKSKTWTGRRVKLMRDPDVTYGKDKTGGTRIAALSHIEGRIEVPILISQGRAGIYAVEPLTEPAPTAAQMNVPTAEQIDACTDTAELGAMWKANPKLRALIEARVRALKAAPDDGHLFPDPAATAPGGAN